MQLNTTHVLEQALNGVFTLQYGNDDVVVLWIQCAVNDHLIAIFNAGPDHRVTLDGKYEGGWFISDQVSIEIQLLLGVVRCGGWESSTDPV